MSKYNLYYSELGSSADVECKKFKSAIKRAFWMANRVIGIKRDRVFVLVVSYDDNDDEQSDVYVFDNWRISGIGKIVENRWKSFWLYECESYEQAYKLTLDLKEPNPLCYTN